MVANREKQGKEGFVARNWRPIFFLTQKNSNWNIYHGENLNVGVST